jgi:hypothetical protein
MLPPYSARSFKDPTLVGKSVRQATYSNLRGLMAYPEGILSWEVYMEYMLRSDNHV